MDWFVAEVTIYIEGDPNVEHVLVPSDNGFVGAMEKLKTWYGNDMESVSLSYLASDYDVLRLPESIINDIVDYGKDNYV